MYFVKVVSDYWLNCIKTVPISFQNLILPDKFIPPTQYNKNLEKIGYSEVISKIFGIQDLILIFRPLKIMLNSAIVLI